MALKTIFKRIRGRIVPIRVSGLKSKPLQDEFVNIVEVRSARKTQRTRMTQKDPLGRMMEGIFNKGAKKRSKQTGKNIARRLARLNRVRKK